MGLCLVFDMTLLKSSYELADAELTLPPPVFSFVTNADTSTAAFEARALDAVVEAYSWPYMALALALTHSHPDPEDHLVLDKFQNLSQMFVSNFRCFPS